MLSGIYYAYAGIIGRSLRIKNPLEGSCKIGERQAHVAKCKEKRDVLLRSGIFMPRTGAKVALVGTKVVITDWIV